MLCHQKKQTQTIFGNSKKCIYGLDVALRKWYNRVKTYLLPVGLIMSKANPGLFYYHEHNNLYGMIAIHTDDFLWSVTDCFVMNFISKLPYALTKKKENQSDLQYLAGIYPINFNVQ